MTTSLDDLPQPNVNSQPNVNLNITEQNVTVPNPAQDLEAKRNADLQQVMSQATPQQNQPPATRPVEAESNNGIDINSFVTCLLYTSPSPRDSDSSRMPSSA